MRWTTTQALGMIAGCLALSALPLVSAMQPTEDHDAAVKATIDAGGRVMKISQASDDLEVAFHLSDQEITDLALQRLPEIEHVIWLNLGSTKISNEGLAAVGKMKDLKKLHLEKTAIGDDGLQHLSKLEGLEYLNLYGTQVTDDGLKHLAGLANLRRLFVWQSRVTDEGIASLSSQLPELEIVAGVQIEVPSSENPDEKKDDADKKKKESDADKGGS